MEISLKLIIVDAMELEVVHPKKVTLILLNSHPELIIPPSMLHQTYVVVILYASCTINHRTLRHNSAFLGHEIKTSASQLCFEVSHTKALQY